MSQNVEMSTPSKYPHDLSHFNAFSSPSQFLIPFSPLETLPADFHHFDPSLVVEMFPFNSLFFGQITANVDTFFVSLRTIYGDQFYKWFLLRKVKVPTVRLRDVIPGSTVVHPAITNQYWKLLDMLGYPINITSGAGTVNPYPVNPTKFFAYFKIVRDYYLDPTLDTELIGKIDDALYSIQLDSIFSSLGFGPSEVPDNLDQVQMALDANAETAFHDLWRINGEFTEANPTSCLIQRRIRRDYFTSLLPNLQFGEPMRVPVEGPFANDTQGNAQGLIVNTQRVVIADNSQASFAASPVYVTGGSIRDLQRVESVQKFLERLNFAGGDGAHPKDLLDAIYGESPENITLGRSVWIDSFDRQVIMQEVVQNAPSNGADNFLGSKAANGTIAAQGKPYSIFCKEHGYVINMFSLMPTVYYAYCPRDSFKHDFADYYLPDLAMIGEQEVLGQELISQVDHTDESEADGTYYTEELIGYQPRYQEYRKRPNELHGAFRTAEAAQMLHGRIFNKKVNLNPDFITYPNEAFNQIFAYINPQADTCYVDVYSEIHSERPVIDNPTRV